MLARSNKAQLGCSLSLSRGTSGNARLARGTLRSKLREGRSGSKFPSTVSALPSFGLTAKDAHFADLMIVRWFAYLDAFAKGGKKERKKEKKNELANSLSLQTPFLSLSFSQFAPKQFEEVASDTIEALNDGRTVLLNLNFLATTAEQQRLLDFVTGGCYALGVRYVTFLSIYSSFLYKGCTLLTSLSFLIDGLITGHTDEGCRWSCHFCH